VMPFVTEEIWGFLPGERGLLLASTMPQPLAEHRDAELEQAAEHDMDVVSEARRIANEGAEPLVTLAAGTLFASLLPKSAKRSVDPAAAAASVVAAADRSQLEAKLAAARAERDRAAAKLDNPGFMRRAPAELVAAEREKLERFGAEVSELERKLADL
jgi:valyl-tRNA synthetase